MVFISFPFSLYTTFSNLPDGGILLIAFQTSSHVRSFNLLEFKMQYSIISSVMSGRECLFFAQYSEGIMCMVERGESLYL